MQPAIPRFTLWRPGADDPQDLRFWQAPRMGDIVSCRFPDFLRGALDMHTSSKIRPCMVVGAEEFLSGQVIVRVAYGSSQIRDRDEVSQRGARHGLQIEGIQPGELFVRSDDTKTGLISDTKFCLRKIIELPFSSEHFPPADGLRFGIYPKRGRINQEDPAMQRSLTSAIAEAKSLGSALEDVHGQQRIKRDFRTGMHIR